MAEDSSIREAAARPGEVETALRQSEERLALAARAGGVGVWESAPDREEVIYSPRAREIWGFPADGPVTRAMTRERTHPDDLEALTAQSQRALDPALREREPYEYRILHPELGTRWARAYGEAMFEDGPEGPRAVRYVGTIEDVTEERRLKREVKESEDRLRVAVGAARMAIVELDVETGFVTNPELNRMFGFPDDAAPTVDEINARYLSGERERMQTIGNAALARGERWFETEAEIQWPSGEVRWLLARAEFQFHDDGTPYRVLGVMIDITERKADEERLRLLAREVDHRAHNLLTVVQGAIALSNAQSVDELKETLIGRVGALARAHQLLAEGRWESADLGKLVRDELRPYAGDRDRATISGPTVPLPPRVAQTLAMVVHELATNAVKYGALSKDGGRVDVNWSLSADRRLALRWEEAGGPPVTKPTRQGLGTSMMARAFAGHPEGGVLLDWRPAGLVCDLRVSLGDGADDAGATLSA